MTRDRVALKPSAHKELERLPDHPHRASATSTARPTQDIVITVQGAYTPSEIVLKKDVPARLRFSRKDNGQCASELLIPALGVKKTLAPLAETLVEITPMQTGEFEMTCGMKMLRGRIVVKD